MDTTAQEITLVRRLITVTGVVQGVGFRPFVYNLALSLHLSGQVCNRSGDVLIDVEGACENVQEFTRRLRSDAPPAARIDKLNYADDRPSSQSGFTITPSVEQAGQYQPVSPDIATCPECRKEILDAADRRHNYPFTNCTNCGPRFTIIEDIPYDRPKTTMRSFQMCPACEREYRDPSNRRFHAQPNACPVCGPQLSLLDAGGKAVDRVDHVADAAQLLREGKIVAIKGLGGFQLACDATSSQAVSALRTRKRRPSKPFAVMVRDIEAAQEQADLSEPEETLLKSPGAPIVLARANPHSTLCPEIAPRQVYLGLMLPYTPLHHLLMQAVDLPLVMTSGNLSEEPIAKDNDEAVRRLSGIADFFLVHNRDVYSRYDDSVTLYDGEKVQLVRRARGYAPLPIRLPYASERILACGAELKNTFCLTRDDNAFISQHIGDLENIETFEAYEETIGLYESLFKIEPELIAYDLHPEYLSTKYALETAEKSGLPLVGVQHHHAHIVSCAVDNGLEPEEQVLGVSFDGTGYGPDGTLWGGEFLLSRASGYQRLSHLSLAPLPGGALAIRNPYRTALGYLYAAIGDEAFTSGWGDRLGVEKSELELIRRQIERRINCPETSSCGRLFDAVAALIGICRRTSYEAEGAIDLEMAATRALMSDQDILPYEWDYGQNLGVVDCAPLIRTVAAEIGMEEHGIIAARFHLAVAQMIAAVAEELSRTTGIRKVALSGGVFQNRLLLKLTRDALRSKGLEVLTHSQVPCNDGGISLGQAVIAHYSKAL